MWNTIANNTQVAEELDNDVPTLDETVRQTMEQFGEGNALSMNWILFAQDLKHLQLAYCTAFCI